MVKGPILGLMAKAGQGPVLGPRPSNTAPHRHSPAPSGAIRRLQRSPAHLRHLRHQRFPRMPCLSCLVCRRISSLNIFLQLFELMPVTAHCSVHMPKHPKRGGGPILWMCHAELANPPCISKPAPTSRISRKLLIRTPLHTALCPCLKMSRR